MFGFGVAGIIVCAAKVNILAKYKERKRGKGGKVKRRKGGFKGERVKR